MLRATDCLQGESGGVPALVAGQMENAQGYAEGLDPSEAYLLWAVNGYA